MAKLEWSPRALKDLAGIAEYIAADSRRYAAETVRKIKARVKPLCQHPHMGRVVPEVGEEILREVFMGAYRIIYEIFEGKIGIVRVIHTARDLMPEDVGRSHG